MTKQTKICTAPRATQKRVGIGHNGAPKVMPFGLKAAWLRFAREKELRDLAKLHVRIQRKKAAMQELVGQRQRIMNRCIRRMRRNAGKN